jgi:hypothetical protein
VGDGYRIISDRQRQEMDAIDGTGHSMRMWANISCLEANQRLSRPNRAWGMVSDMWRSVGGGYSIIPGRWRRGKDAVGHGCFTSFCTGNGMAGEKEQIHDASLLCLHNPMSSIRPAASFHFSSIPKQLLFNHLPTKVLKKPTK